MNRRQFLHTATATTAALKLGGCSQSEIRVIDSLPVSKFGQDSTAEEVTLGIDLAGKTAVVTGCNSGIGLETMRVLALRGAHVIGTGRTMEKAAAACNQVAGYTTPVVLELSDFESVVKCSDTIAGLVPQIDILVGNAGMISGAELELVNGIERSFAVNHLGHFIFVNRLVDRITAAPQGRVLMVSSSAAFDCMGIEFDNLSGARGYDRRRFYSQTKLANALFSLALAGRFADIDATSNSIHPGVIVTNIARHEPWFFRTVFNTMGGLFTKTVPQGAATSCYVATSPDLAGVNGYFFMDCNAVRLTSANHLYDVSMAWQLWNVSEQLTAQYLN